MVKTKLISRAIRSNRLNSITVIDMSSDAMSGYYGNEVVVARRCPHPGHVPNSHRLNPALFYFPNNVTYRCLEGYRLIGDAQRRCLETGRWSGRLPICRRKSASL